MIDNFSFYLKKRHFSYKRRDHISWELQYMSNVFFYVEKTCGFSYNSDLALKIWHYMSPFFVPNMYILWWKKLTLFTFLPLSHYNIFHNPLLFRIKCISVKINWFWCKHNTTETFFYAKKASFPHFLCITVLLFQLCVATMIHWMLLCHEICRTLFHLFKFQILTQNREMMEKLEELETSHNHLLKRLDKLKNAKSTLLKELWSTNKRKQSE